MAKRDQMGGNGLSKRYQQPTQVPPKPVVKAEPIQPTIQPVDAEPQADTIPKWRRCPICWERCKGVGVSYSKQGNRRFYKCKRTESEHPPCGHTWTAIVQLSVLRIEHREVDIESR